MHEFVIDKCELIEEPIRLIEVYTKDILQPSEFNNSEDKLIRLDASMMRLRSIGENIKKIWKVGPGFFEKILLFDTNNIIRFRDFISHHYEKLHTEIVFEICKNDIPDLKQRIHFLIKQQ